MNLELSYGDVQDVVLHHLGSGSAAEAHGLLAGLLCMDSGIACGAWLESLEGPATEPPDDSDRQVLGRLFDATRRQLDDFDFSFELLLPDDDTPIEERAEALAEWCQGFLAGLGYGTKGNSGWPGECAEVLADIGEIARLDPGGVGESAESDYAELSEYVRVGVQVICSELQAGTPRQLH
jgi:uncharacterized protein YgfB (UPF0149 family)